MTAPPIPNDGVTCFALDGAPKEANNSQRFRTALVAAVPPSRHELANFLENFNPWRYFHDY